MPRVEYPLAEKILSIRELPIVVTWFYREAGVLFSFAPRRYGMEQLAWACTRCSRIVGPGDTILFGPGGLSHVDCRRPRVPSAEERALLFSHCWDHAVECAPCASSFRLSELGSDLRGHTNLCPHCRQDLTDKVRAHLYKCDAISEIVRHRAQAVRAAWERLVRESGELRDAAVALMREAQAALEALREAMRQSPRGNPESDSRPELR